MATSITLTGTGTPLELPGRAGASVLVRSEGVSLQFDAGRAVVLRWADAGLNCGDLTAIFLTHHHSDHLVGLADLVLTSWERGARNPMPIIAPLGPTADFAARVLEQWEADVDARMQQVEGARVLLRPAVDVRPFGVRRRPVEVWRRNAVAVEAIEVHHEPVVPAVGYRVNTPAGNVAISGDTVACAEVEELARGCAVLVHETCRSAQLCSTGEAGRRVAEYHADAVDVGALAARAGVRVVMLTHLLPAPSSEDEERLFLDDIRHGGFQGEVVVGRDLSTVHLSGLNAHPEITPGLTPTVSVDLGERVDGPEQDVSQRHITVRAPEMRRSTSG